MERALRLGGLSISAGALLAGQTGSRATEPDFARIAGRARKAGACAAHADLGRVVHLTAHFAAPRLCLTLRSGPKFPRVKDNALMFPNCRMGYRDAPCMRKVYFTRIQATNSCNTASVQAQISGCVARSSILCEETNVYL